MATDIENLQTRRSAITAELAAGNSKPSYSIGGQSVSWTEYRLSLYEEMDKINNLIRQLGGPWMVRSRGIT